MQILLEKFLNLGECQIKFICLNFAEDDAPLTIHFPFVSYALCLAGDDRNIVEVFVAGRKVVPFPEENQRVL